MTKQYFITVDGGGTNTEIVVFDNKLRVKEKLITGCININQINNYQFNITMNNILKIIIKYEYARIMFGIPGYSQSSDVDRYLNQYFYKNVDATKFEYFVVNDALLAHYGSFGLQDGILIIAGTGSMAIKISNGVVQQIGGWGHLIGDEGSGFKIGYAALNHVTKVFDGLEQHSILSELICDRNNFDFISKIFRYVYSSPNYRISVACLSKLVDEAANLGCPVAIAILKAAASNLVTQVEGLIDDTCCQISYSGRVFDSSTIRTEVAQQLNNKAIFNDPLLPPILGGILWLLNENEHDSTHIGLLKTRYFRHQLRRI